MPPRPRRQQPRGVSAASAALARVFDSFTALHHHVGASRYKVHKPGCDCGRIVKVLKTFPPRHNDNGYQNGFIILPDTQNSRQMNLYYHRLPIPLLLPGGGGGGGAGGDKGTTKRFTDHHHLAEAEWHLRNVLFPPLPAARAVGIVSQLEDDRERDDTSGIGAATSTDNTTTTASTVRGGVNQQLPQQQNFKISCAACLLADQPNGFVGICSPHRSLVEYVRDQARLESRNDRQTTAVNGKYGINDGSDGGGWHHDHAIDSIVVEASELMAVLTARTRHQSALGQTQLLTSLRRESNSVRLLLDQDATSTDVEIGHHLKTMLELMGDGDSNSNNNDSGITATFWFVMVQHTDQEELATREGTHRIILDLPGGKRHLGETSLECAIRETREETSLRIHQDSWSVVDILCHPKEPVNHYFRLLPPVELLSTASSSLPKQSQYRTTTTKAPTSATPGGVNITDALAGLKVSEP